MAKKKKQKKKNTPSKQPVVSRPKEFLDLIAPAAVKFNTDHFILGGTYRSVVALRSYPPTTEELALLRRLGEMAGVTLRLSARRVTTAEEDAIIHAATNKNRMERSNFSNIKQSVTAEEKNPGCRNPDQNNATANRAPYPLFLFFGAHRSDHGRAPLPAR